MGDHEPAESGVLASAGATIRLVVGWGGAAIGVLNLAMGIDLGTGTTDGSYLVFHLVLVVTGVVLLIWSLLTHRPGLLDWVTGTAVAGFGLVLAALPTTTIVCCLHDFPVRHGYPFTILAKGDGSWHTDGWRTFSDLLFWVCVGFLVLTLMMLVRRRAPMAPAPAPAGRHSTHAEERSADAPAPHDENVGGLP